MIRKIINILFIVSGAKFYMDYILLSNPVSKNPLIHILFGWSKSIYSAFDYRSRHKSSMSLFIIHLTLCFIMFILKRDLLLNALVNIYPMIVQVYVGYRLHIIIKFKNERFYKNNKI